MNHKFYIGSAVNLNSRKSHHFSNLKNNKHENDHLQKAYNKYGESNFTFEVIEYVEDVNLLLAWEQLYFEMLHPEYNICKVAGSCLGIKGHQGWLGKKHSEETKRKIGLKSKGRKPWLGKKLSDDHKRKIGEKNKGNKPWFGKKHSEETKKKIRKNSKNKKPILQYNLDGILIKKWESIISIKSELGIDTQGITKCCLGRYKKSHNYIWKYKEK